MEDQRTVRRATAADVEALTALRAEMFTAMGTDANGPWRDSARRWFAARVNDPRCCFVVVEVDGGVVSCAIGIIRDTPPSPGNPSGGDIHINNVCTFPPHRGRAHASTALAEVMRWAAATGIGRVELMATEDGQELYEREGFVLHDYPAMRARLPQGDT